MGATHSPGFTLFWTTKHWAAFQRPALARSRLWHASTRSSSIAAMLLRLGGSGQQPVSTTGGAVSKSSPVLHCRTDLMPLVSARGGPLAVLPSVLLIALLAPLVSYRRRDVLLLLVPLWNLVVLWTIGSRISRLPYRDWPLRPDEVDRQTIPAQHFAVICSVPLSG
jgi:hypothetical protein